MMSRTTRPKKKLTFDALEAREVPATATLTDGTLLITGTDAGDTIRVRQTATTIRVDGVDRVVRHCRPSPPSGSTPVGGNDAIRLDMPGAAVTKPAVVRAGSGDDMRQRRARGRLHRRRGRQRPASAATPGPTRSPATPGPTSCPAATGTTPSPAGPATTSINGGTGTDHLWGGADFDVISGGAGHDHVYDDFAFWAVQVNDTDYVHHHIAGLADNSGFGWFDANMPDADLRRQARAAARNDFVGRAETIALFEQATDGTDVNATEFDSLKNLVNTDQVRIDAQARYFGQKIMNGDPANQWFTGGAGTRHALGNLARRRHRRPPADADRQVVPRQGPARWPRAATGRPPSATGRRRAGCSSAGPSATDIEQGDVGDCYFLAGLGARRPQGPGRASPACSPTTGTGRTRCGCSRTGTPST